MIVIRLQDIFTEKNVKYALDSFSSKNDGCGRDGVRISELPEYWEMNKDKILKAIYEGNYNPGIVMQLDIVAKNGKKRGISQLNSIDRLISRVLAQYFSDEWEKDFSEYSYAYQKEKGTMVAASHAAELLEQGKIWCAELDIRHYFDVIPHDRLIEKVKKKVKEQDVRTLLYRFIKCPIENDYEITQKKVGIVQGSPLSPLLSNLYLDDFDHELERCGYGFCRFGDDVNIYCETYEEAVEAMETARKYLEEVEKLTINEKKSGIFSGLNRCFLGFRFQREKNNVLIARRFRDGRHCYEHWYTTGIRKIDKNYHLVNSGILTRRDFNVLFENEEQKYYIPVETMDSLYVHSNITLTGTFLEFANKKGLSIAFIDKYGSKIGSFIPQNSRKDAQTTIAQARIYEDETERLKVAKRLEISGLSNMRANVRYYARRLKSVELKEIAAVLSECIKQMNEGKTLQELMLIEARARQKYYLSFRYIIKDKTFHFETRTKRPPKDAINAMISFGNTLMYQRIANEINRTSLDIRFGFIHATGKRSESLNLDLADLFKPIIVDRTIFTLINRKMIDAGRDFQQTEKGGVYLNKNGKRIFIQEFERKIYSLVNDKDAIYSYDTLLRREVQKLRHYIEQGEEYRPYKYAE